MNSGAIDLRGAVADLERANFALRDVPADVRPPCDWVEDFSLDAQLERRTDFSLAARDITWPEGLNFDAWDGYVRALARSFADALGLRACRLRVGQTSRDECRLFHCDNVSVRLFQTLRGLGTEYLLDDNVNRDGLGRGRNDLVVRDPTRVRYVPEGTVILMKGERAARGRGLVHRSPPIAHAGLRRMYCSLDEVFEPPVREAGG